MLRIRNDRSRRLPPQLMRIMGLSHLRELTEHEAAEHANLPIRRFRQALSLLRGRGLARTVALHRPEQLGAPVHVRALVRLDGYHPRASVEFERSCREDPSVSSAAAITGDYDYLLFGHHSDIRAKDAWVRVLRSRPTIRAVDCQVVEVRFGHMLPGVAITTPDLDDETATS